MPSLTPGQEVKHPDYGLGIVQDKRDNHGWVLVIFDRGQHVYFNDIPNVYLTKDGDAIRSNDSN